MSAQAFDAVLVLSFGGPEGPDDVIPFLRNVTRGRNVPDERLAIVAEQYDRFGGRSPINDHCRALVAAIEAELGRAGIDLPVYWGNRNWHPMVTDTVARMAEDGIGRALVFATSAFGSYSGCRQYREDLDRARDAVGPASPELRKLRLFYNHPGFIEPMARNLLTALAAAETETDNRAETEIAAADDAGDPSGAERHRIVFSAHSIPESMARSCSYPAQLAESAHLVMERAGLGDRPWDLVYQSRSGPPSVPWLEPDVNQHLEGLADRGFTGATLVPLGFVSDHMEVLFDLDTQAAATARERGLTLHRAATVGTDPRFVAMIRELIDEQLGSAPRLAIGSDGPWPDQCPDRHCLAPTRPVPSGASPGS